MKHNKPSSVVELQTQLDETQSTLNSIIVDSTGPADLQLRLKQFFEGHQPVGREGNHKDCPSCH